MPIAWKKGRGKLGFLQPLIGDWVAVGDSPAGRYRCLRSYHPTLDSSYIELRALWLFGPPAAEAKPATVLTQNDGGYRETAIIGAGADGEVGLWSFTSDGKRSEGKVADVSDLHTQAIGFHAQMPAGLARMSYWPDGDDNPDGFVMVVEAQTTKGWSRMIEHHYRPL